ncbi:MAG: sporulation transcriptional regulator SpoIIID [Clostridium sp.]
MKEYIEERAVEIANYIIDHNATVRQTAKKFGISKSTVHKDVTDRLEDINPSLAAQARVVLNLIRRNATSAGDWLQKKSISISFRPAAPIKNFCNQQRNKTDSFLIK